MGQDDFDLEGLARYLHLDPAVVGKMVDRGQIPGRKVGGAWRFAQGDIHHWLESRIGALEDVELERLEKRLEDSATEAAEEVPTLAELLRVEAVVVPLDARTRSSVIRALVEQAASTGLLWDPAKMIEAVRTREEMHPTTLDNGVALLHPRRPMGAILGEPLLALGRTDRPIPFTGGYGQLTDVFFLICSVEDRGHLRVLARLSRLLSHPEFLPALRAARDARSAWNAVRDTEAELFG